MAKWQYAGDEPLIFPTLGLTVSKNDVFEGPEDLSATGVVSAAAKAKVSITAPVADAPVADATAETPAPVDAEPVVDASTDATETPTPDTAPAETN